MPSRSTDKAEAGIPLASAHRHQVLARELTSDFGQIQKSALWVVKLQKEAAKINELAVKRFQAEVLKNQSRQYAIQQQIVETENRLNFLLGRFPQHIDRSAQRFVDLVPPIIHTGIPS